MEATLHGSMRKYYDKFQKTKRIFSMAGIDIIAPKISKVLSNTGGFIMSEGDDLTKTQIETEAEFLRKTANLDTTKDFCYIINPEGYIWTSTAFELGKILSIQKRVFALEEIIDPPALLPKDYVYTPSKLVNYIQKNNFLPPLQYDEKNLESLKNMVNPLLAVGGIVINENGKLYNWEKLAWFIQKPSWENGQYTLLGGTKKPWESDEERLKKEFQEQLWISDFHINNTITSFTEILNSWYRNTWTFRQFIDYTLLVNSSPKISQGIWLPPTVALNELSLENNARETLTKYLSQQLLLR